MANVLLVDTNFSAQPIREYLLAKGHRVWVIGSNPNDALARQSDQYLPENYAQPDVIQRCVEAHEIDFIVPGCNDVSHVSCARAAAVCGLPGFDCAQTISRLHHKHQLRQLGQELGLSMPKVFDTPQQWLDHEVIVKPVDAFSGKGVVQVRCKTEVEQQQVLEHATSFSSNREVVVESFVSGTLYSHSCFLVGQRVASECFVRELSGANPWVVDTSYVTTEGLPAEIQASIRAEVEQLAKHLNLTDGLLHTQFIRTETGFSIIEITRRCPGDLYSQLVDLSNSETGTAPGYVANYVAPFLGQPIAHPIGACATPILRHTLTQTGDCLLHALSFSRSMRIRKWVPLAMSGDALSPSPSGRMAVAFFEARSQDELADLAQAAVQRSLFEVEASHA